MCCPRLVVVGGRHWRVWPANVRGEAAERFERSPLVNLEGCLPVHQAPRAHHPHLVEGLLHEVQVLVADISPTERARRPHPLDLREARRCERQTGQGPNGNHVAEVDESCPDLDERLFSQISFEINS